MGGATQRIKDAFRGNWSAHPPHQAFPKFRDHSGCDLAFPVCFSPLMDSACSILPNNAFWCRGPTKPTQPTPPFEGPGTGGFASRHQSSMRTPEIVAHGASLRRRQATTAQGDSFWPGKNCFIWRWVHSSCPLTLSSWIVWSWSCRKVHRLVSSCVSRGPRACSLGSSLVFWSHSRSLRPAGKCMGEFTWLAK